MGILTHCEKFLTMNPSGTLHLKQLITVVTSVYLNKLIKWECPLVWLLKTETIYSQSLCDARSYLPCSISFK